MARNTKEGIKVYLKDPSGNEWIGCLLRHCDQTLMNEILTHFDFGLYNHVDRTECDGLPEVMSPDLKAGDVYRMFVMGRECYLVDPCNELVTIMRRMSICGRIYRERIKKGITQERLSKLSGIPKKSISQIERGLWSPTIDIMIKVGAALGIELKYVEANNE